MTLAPGQVLGSYEIVAFVAEGGAGRVYRVRHVQLGTEHAIKVLHPEFLGSEDVRMRLLDEARVQAQLLHPNILRVTDLVIAPGVAGFVMDFVEGASLEQDLVRRVEQRRPYGPAEIREVFLPVLDAIGFAHGRGVIHRDLKPANILLGRDHAGRLAPKVADFGIAKLDARLGRSGKRATVAARMMGTHGYMSPEQIQSATDVDHRADIFSLGATLLEMATLSPPFEAASDFETMRRIVDGRFEIPEELERRDPALARTVRRALSPDRAQRIASCAEFVAALGTGDRPPASTAARPTIERMTEKPSHDHEPRRSVVPSTRSPGPDATARARKRESPRQSAPAAGASSDVRLALWAVGVFLAFVLGLLWLSDQWSLPNAPRNAMVASPLAPIAPAPASVTGAPSVQPASGSRGDRFRVVGDGTVIDTQTNLMWGATDNGSDIDWPGAKRYADDLTLGGHSDWRMPTQEELSALYQAAEEAGSTAAGVKLPRGIRLTGWWYWASETRGSEAANVYFGNGVRFVDDQGISGGLRVLPVRVRN